MKRLLRKLTSFAIALFMVLQVMLPAFATRSKAEELEPNTIKNIENLETNEDAYLSITNSQKIYDKKKIDKDESKFSIAVGLPSTSSSFRLVKRNDLKLYEDKFFQTNEDASKEYWRIKDMLNLQGLDLDLEIIKEDQGYKILTKNEMENLEQGKKDNFYGENYSYIDFKILDDFDFDEKGNQKLLNQDKLVFNLEFIKNISPDPNYNLFEQDEQGNWNIKNEGDIFALINEDKKNLYDTNSLTNDLNSLNAYKEERKQAEEEKAQKEAEQKAEEERKAEEEKKAAEEKAKEEEEKKAEEKKAQEEKQKEENANFEKANKELKEALEDENNSIEDIQKLLTELGEKYNLSLANQEKLMAENDSAIKALVEKDRDENFRANMLRQLPRKVPSNSWDGKLFHLNLEMNVKASPANPIPEGWYFDVQLGPYLKDDIGQIWNDLYDGGRLIASPVYDKAKHVIRYVFQTRVTKVTKLTVDQYLGFDLKNIGEQRDIDIDIKVAPKNNPIQSMTTKHVNINDDNPVESSYNVVSQGQSEAKHYPFQLNWTSEQQYYGGTNPTVEWNIEVDTASLKDKNLDFNNLNVSIFAGAEQGLNNFKFKASTNKFDLDDTRNYISSSRLGEILQKNTSIAKNELGEKLYIRVKAEVNKTRLHDYYSIGLRINPDGNYIKKMLDEFIEEYNKLPAIIKWMKGAEQAKEFSKLPFNLVETMIPAKSTERDNFTSENLYYDSSRTIYAKRDSDTNVDWYALDLLRLGEKPDQAFNNPEFLINNSTDRKSITPKVFYYVPQENGLYKKTPDIGAVVTEYGDFYPGTLISYEYDNQIGTRDDTYRFNANIKEKKVNNLVGETTTGGRINLFTKKVSNKDLTDKYLAYLENPYPIMRINKNFDMVQCFNKGTPDPSFKGSDGIFLDIHEDPSGDYLISRLNERVGNPKGNYRLVDHLSGQVTSDGIYLNPNGMDQGQAMEDLMKRIYFYGEQVKKEYTQGKFNDLIGSETNDEVMHRLIENSMYQRVLHHFTDGVSISEDFFETSSNYNEDSWKVNYTLTGDRNADGSWKGDYFDGEKKNHNTYEGLRKLKDNETTIKNYPIVKNTQYEMANELLKKVIASYKKGSDWNKDKANTVQLVFYSHTKEGQYQELITGRITEPLEIDKYTNDGKTKLEGAKFTFINKYTNEKVEWTSKKDNNDKLYLKPGYYIVQEEAPSGYEPIKEFEIQVKRSLVNEDKGPYKFKNLPEIHVNDGYKTEVIIKDKDIPKSAEGTNLVEIDKDNKVKVKLTNIQDNLGDLEFVKKNEFAKLNGAEFTLRKVTADSVEDVKNQIKAQKEDPTQKIKYDDAYRQTSKGYYGEFKFEQIPKGYYILEETKVPAGYQKAPLYILEAKEETVAGKNKVVLHFVGENAPKEKDGDLTIVRNYPKETEIEFRKIREIQNGEEKQGLTDARFRLESLWTKDGSTYLKDLTSDSIKKDGGKENEKGYFRFDKLVEGNYKLTEIQAPYGYQVLDSYWRIEVREVNGELVKTVYEVKKDGSGEKKINLNDESVYELTNKPRKIDIQFTKYLGELEKDEDGKIKLDKDGKPIVHKEEYKKQIPGKDNKPVSFDLYSSDYYGAIIGKKVDGKIQPIQTGITQAEDGFFHLKGLEFGKYYVLRETNPPEGYNVANDILLKVEAEAITNVGEMKVIVRDPNTNADTGDHSIFKGVIDFREGEQLGKFSIRKTGNAISYVDKNGKLVTIGKDNPKIVGLRRAYFRLYTANKEFEIEKNPGGYAKEYIQKVTPGNPIILYLTEEKAKTMSQEDLNKLGVVGYKNFKSKDGKEVSYAVDKDGKRFRIGEDPSTLPANQGIVTFDNLKPGYYVLQEFRGPAGYEKTTDEWYVYVDEAGRTYRSDKKFDPKTLAQGIQSISSITNPSMSPRLQMAGLDISDQLPINRLLAPSLEEDLQDIEYDSSTDDLNIKVKASKVDTTNGKRTINFSISPKEKEVPGKKIQMVFLVERSKDSATTAAGQGIAKGRTLDKNINYAITQIAKKAEETGTQVDVSFIEYSDRTTALKTTNSSLNKISKDLQDVNYENMYFDGEGEKANQTYKEFLANANISQRNNSNNDGSQKLLDSIDSYLTSISKDGYDKKIMIDFANFHVEKVKRYGAVNGQFKFKKADLVNKFKDGGFETFVVHTDQKTFNLASGYQSQYADTVMPQLKYFEYFKNDDGRNGKAYYVYKNMVNEVLNNDGFVNNSDGLLVKDGKLDIGLRPLINLLSTSAKIGTNDISNNIVKDSTNNTISLGGINLKKGESLEFSYTIDLKEGTDFDKNYPINKSDIDKGVKFTNNGKENLISSTYPKSNGELYTKKIKETPPAPNTYKIKINPSENGSVTASKSININKGEVITLTVNPSNGYRLKDLKVTGANGEDILVTENNFTMPASDVTVSATFVEDTPTPQDGKNFEVNFTYSGSVNGNAQAPDDSSPGKLELFEEGNLTALETQEAKNAGKVQFNTKLDPSKNYRLVYTREDKFAKDWALPNVSNYTIDSKSIADAKDTVSLNIANGNTMDIFNKDETGFRIPLRITKVNENNGVLTGAQFRARKLLKSDQIIDEKPPVYGNEEFDGVSEATGLPGDNYFRELSPGLYELTEIKAPSGAYRLPKDENGNDKKWYFKVEVAKDANGNYKKPSDDDYMKIEFQFTETLPENVEDARWAIPKKDRKELLGKPIKGIKLGDNEYDKFTQIIKDDHRSDPARPDAPYKGIDDVRVTNFLKTTELGFYKKDLATYQNIDGADFILRRAKLDGDGNLTFDNEGNPKYENLNEKEKADDGKEYDKFIKPEGYDETINGVKKTSKKDTQVLFSNLEQGTYILKETKPSAGYKLEDKFLAITFKADEKGYWKQVIKAYEKQNGKYVEVENPGLHFQKDQEGDLDIVFNNKDYIDFKFQKIEGVKDEKGNDILVESSDFRVTQVDEDGKPIPGGYDQPKYSYVNSKFTFTGLGVGRYKLQETRALEKFIKPDPWYFRVVQDPKTYKLKIVFEDHDASIRFTPENETDGKNTPQLDDKGNPKDIKVANYKKTKFVFKKQDQDGNILPDVYFNLKKLRQTFDSKAYDYDAVSGATYMYNKSARSQKSGSVTFDTLGEGIYELRETDKPEGYDSKAVQDRWIITVEKTENGLQAKYNKAFEKKYYEKYANHDKNPNKEEDNYYTTYIKNGFDKKSNLEQKQVGEFNYILTNTKTTVDLKWKKVTVNKDIIKDKQTKFVMLKNSDDPTKLDAAKDGNSSSAPYELIETDGTFEVNNLSKGVYTLIETKAPDGFKEMDRQIVIQIYEDAKDNYKLKKKFYEMKKDGNGDNVLVDKTQEFSYIFTRKNNTEVDTDGSGYFYVKNDEKQQYFYLTKGFLTDSNGRKVFNNITKGELHLKLTNTEDDKDVFRTTIDLAKGSNAGIYKFDVNGIKTGKTYLLEEEKAPNGYKLSTNKYKLLFVNDTQNPGKVIAILKAVLDKNNKELKNARGQLVTEYGKVIGDGITINIADPNSILKVINEKNKVEFTKVGKDEEKGEGGKLITKEDPLQNVEFILQKQDPKDWDKENKGYYPVTKDIEFIKKDNEGLYIEKSDGTKQRKVGVSNVTIDNSAYKGKSDAKGKFTFEGLTDGFYQIMEPNAPEGFMQVNGPVKKFRVLEGKIYIYDKVGDDFIEKEVTDDNIGTLGKIINEKPGKGEFKIKKVDENNRPLANVKYTLHKTDENETQVGEERITDENGEISFKDLPYGYYWLKERKTINGYILDTKKKLITLGGGDWGKTPDRQSDVSKYITFDGDQKELISTADIPSKTTVYPNKAEGMIANFKFKIDPNKEIRPGDYFTIDFSDNIDLDGIFKDNDNKGKNPDSQFDIIGPAGKLAEAKINPDRTSITYTFTKYVGDYRPDFMSMFMQIFPNRRVVDHTQDITVEVNIGDNTDKTNTNYHYSDSININYRGYNAEEEYDGYQNPDTAISSYMLRLDPDQKTFTAILYLNPWNSNIWNKSLSFTTDKYIKINENLSVKTYVKTGSGSHKTVNNATQGWQNGDLPDSYDINEDDLELVSDSKYDYDVYARRVHTEVNYYDGYDYRKYDYSARRWRYYQVTKDNTLTDRIELNSVFNENGYPNNATYVIEIKGELEGKAQSLKTKSEAVYNKRDNYGDIRTHTDYFKTFSEFFNPGAIGDANKELKLLNFKNKIEFVKIDGGVLSNVVDQSSENPESLKDLGIGRVLGGATFKLQKQNGSSWDEVNNSTRISDDNGVFSWEGLSEGKYRVIETVTPDNEHYDLPTKEVSSFEVDDKGNIVEIQNNKQIIENYKKAEIRVRKTDENGQSIEGAEFLLEKDNDDKYTPNIGTLEKDGTILFNNLPAGKYTLTEGKAPKGYTKSDAVWKLEVTRDGKVKWLNSFDDTNDKMKTVENITYKQNGNKPENLDTEIIGIDKENKTFRQKITIKAKPSDIKKTKLILESTDPSLKLSQANTKVRLVAGDEENKVGNKDNTSYKVEINGGASPNLTLTITPPYKEEDKNKPVGSEQGQTPQEEEKEKYYQFIVDMPYKDEGRIGAKATYQIGTINKTSGKVEFGENDTKLTLDKYLENASQITAGGNKVDMTAYEDKYLARDVNLITLDIANIKNPDIYFKKVDAVKPDKALAGAEFEIRRKNDNGNFVALRKDGSEFLPQDKEEEKWKVKSNAQGQFEFKEIPNGEYQIVETKAPEGYALVDKIVFKFDVENGKIIYKDKSDNKITKNDLNIQYKDKENSDTNRILVTNKKAEYPHTGGPGVWIGYTILGLIIMFVAVLTYSKRKDKLIV